MEDYKVILLRIYLSRGLNYRAFTLYHTRTHAHTQASYYNTLSQNPRKAGKSQRKE